MRLFPIALSTLREAARLRATTKLKTPDAIHAATAQQAGCVLFVSNDLDFRGVAGFSLVILDDLLKPWVANGSCHHFRFRVASSPLSGVGHAPAVLLGQGDNR